MQKKILVVDDEAMLTTMLSDFFSSLHYDVHCAMDWEAASELIEIYQYDAILLDLRLSGGSTESGLAHLRAARERHPLAGIVLQTGYTTDEIASEALRLGADLVLQKPVQLQRFRRILGEFEMRSSLRNHAGMKHSEMTGAIM